MAHQPKFLTRVQDALKYVPEISIEEVLHAIKHSKSFIWVIDVREDNEWNTGHLPGAVHVSKGVIERDIEQVAPDVHSPIILYCGGGYRSALAARTLQEMGYTNVKSMSTGIRGWLAAGFPLDSHKAPHRCHHC